MKAYIEIKNVGNDTLTMISRIPEATGPLEQIVRPGETITCYSLNNENVSMETFIFKKRPCEAPSALDLMNRAQVLELSDGELKAIIAITMVRYAAQRDWALQEMKRRNAQANALKNIRD